MLLVSAEVGPFKSINEPQTVSIEKDVTVLVGMNESGKTVFLQALTKSRDALGLAVFDDVEDYPRKDLTAYLKVHATKPASVTTLTYNLSDGEVDEVNKTLHTRLPKGYSFSTTHTYANVMSVGMYVDERPVVAALASGSALSPEAKRAVKAVSSLRAIADALNGIELSDKDKVFQATIEARIASADKGTKWESVVAWELWGWVKPRIPKFLYFGEYEVLQSKVNLTDLAARVDAAKADPRQLGPEHRGALALLRMADISVEDFSKPGGYEPLKAKIEAVSISLTDQIMEFWKQNEDLEVEVDIKPDPTDVAPFNSGPNLYLRIKNKRHRGVSTPFRQRSRGFIWFFSFLVWFDSVQHQLDPAQSAGRDLILLLDEPGLSLHALAQRDFLKYIDDLARRHQVIYSTHSPFMVHSDRLHQVRTVEDQEKVGTVISADVSGSDPRTIFPLQAALGYTIAQNLFISERNLLVEGPSELVYLQALSSSLEGLKRTFLRPDVTIVPTGGLDKVVTFVALLGASGLKLAVLHDYRGVPDARLMDLAKQKMVSPKAVLNASQFRDLANIGTSGKPTDIEDLLTPQSYLDLFNGAFKTELGGVIVTEKDLPPGDRIIDRLERYLAGKGIQLRPSGGFNHYRVAGHFANNPPKLDADTLSRFEALFKAVNALF